MTLASLESTEIMISKNKGDIQINGEHPLNIPFKAP